MNQKMKELMEQIQNKKAEAKAFLEQKKVSEAKALTQEIKSLQEELEVEAALYEDEIEGVKNKVKNKNEKPKDGLSIEVKAFRNAIMNKPLTPEMQNALRTSSDADGGYLVPTELVEQIETLRRQFVSLKDLTQTIPVISSKGTLPIEEEANFTKLVDFDEVTDLAAIDLKFNNVAFTIKNKGGIVAMSNNLVLDEKAGLPSYVMQNFAKKQIRTENADIIAILESAAPKTLADVKALKKSFNRDLDPGLKGDGFVFIMNQDAFGKLDDETDQYGRPLLQPNPTLSTGKLLFGFPVVVLSNVELPNVVNGANTYAPVFFGNLKAGVVFFDREQYEIASSSEYFFGRNQTALRVIERYDVKEFDASSFVYGQLDVTTYIA